MTSSRLRADFLVIALMSHNTRNFILFLLLAIGLGALWWYADRNWIPKPEKKEQKELTEAEKADIQKKIEEDAKKREEEAKAKAQQQPPVPPAAVKPVSTPAELSTLYALGSDGFYNRVLVSTRGGGIQQVRVPAFPEANRLGEEIKVNGEPVPLLLIPGIVRPRTKSLEEALPLPDIGPGQALDPNDPNTPPEKRLSEPSYILLHYTNPDDKHPDPLLGSINWRTSGPQVLPSGEHQITFETELGDPYQLKIRKVFTLGPKDYHVGLRIEFERLPGGSKAKFRYQVVGPRGMPVEGEWYASTSRVALVGWETPRGKARRQYEDATTIGVQRGGEVVNRADNQFKYAAIANQYFTSALAIDDQATVKNPWVYVRATTELPFDKVSDPNTPQFDDITFRAVAEVPELTPGQTVVHSYVVYNGPAKVRLLKLMTGDWQVDGALVDRYHDALGLRTITDFRSPTTLGAIADAIYWSDLVIVFTNLMHWLLYAIHLLFSDWAVSIIVLTIMVRLLLFVPSKKQTQMNLRMMEIQKKLQPELDKLHEKYKDDFHTYNREKTRLMMQHGFNPFAMMGGCLLLFAQMPIMMGLYFCLQESVFFRLEPFLWINNLSAPDMTLWWTEAIPFISTPDDIGRFYYLGPFLNVLPIIAVSLMMYQQAKLMPPPTDEQMAAQQRMMKIMMIVIAVMFYKVAAGLALYFIISTGWGVVERRFIPKAPDKPDEQGGGSEAKLSPKGGSPNGHPEPERKKGFFGRLREALRKKMEELQKQAEEQAARQIRNAPQNPNQPTRNPQKRDKKKKRRK